MNSYNEYVEITSNKLLINFPVGFYKGKALVTVTPVCDNSIISDIKSGDRNSLKSLLLSKEFTLSDEELKRFSNVEEWMNEWNIGNY
jgi:hypothetical protein